MTTWFGGTFCVESALRKKPMTTTMRTKEVVMMRMLGASVRMVSNAMIWSVTETSCGPFACPMPMLTLGIAGAASAVCGRNAKSPHAIKTPRARTYLRPFKNDNSLSTAPSR